MTNTSNIHIFLVRHGLSEANVDRKKHLEKADWEIELTEQGKQQARGAGEYLRAHLSGPEFKDQKICLWQSPYQRTRQTAEGVLRSIQPIVTKVYETDRLREQEAGIFDGYTDAEREKLFPQPWAHYKKSTGTDYRGKWFARYYGGESGAQVGDRVALFQNSLFRDIQEGRRTHIIISHGLTIRAFVKEFFHHSFEWYGKEPNPDNCSIRLIEGSKQNTYQDRGYIYTGKKEEIAAAATKVGISLP